MDEISRLQAELSALRAEVRRGRRLMGIAAVAAVGLALAGAKGSPSVVRAQQFELVDEAGEVRGTWKTLGGAPILRMEDARAGVAQLVVEEGTASLSLTGEVERALTTEPALPVAEAEISAEVSAEGEAEEEPKFTFAEGRITIEPDLPYVGVRVSCRESGLNYRAPFVAGLAILPELARGDHCVAYFRGAGPPIRVAVQPGEPLACKAREYGMPLCRPPGEGASGQ